MGLMSSSDSQEYRNYALGRIDAIQKKIEIMSYVDPFIDEHYVGYLDSVNQLLAAIHDDFCAWEDDGDLLSKEKVDESINEMLQIILVDCEDVSLYEVLRKPRAFHN